jgi:hypothetical protein
VPQREDHGPHACTAQAGADSGPEPLTGVDRAFELLAAATAGEPLLLEALSRVVAETAEDLQARSELLGALVHTCLVAVGSLSELVGDPVEDLLPLLRSTVSDLDRDKDSR